MTPTQREVEGRWPDSDFDAALEQETERPFADPGIEVGGTMPYPPAEQEEGN
jgi:hypothetical protein